MAVKYLITISLLRLINLHLRGWQSMSYLRPNMPSFKVLGPIPHALQDLTQRIFTEWLPSSGYDYGDGADIEVYSDGDTQAEDYKSEVWVPIAKG
jgi:hypothetical protein